MKNVMITWTGEKRIIPNYGVGDNGETKTLPQDLAESFIKQGLAKLKSKTKTNSKPEEAQ